jgi:hypothetical protein
VHLRVTVVVKIFRFFCIGCLTSNPQPATCNQQRLFFIVALRTSSEQTKVNLRIIKPLIIGLTGLGLVILGISSLLPSQVMTSKWVMIYGEKDVYLNRIRDVNSWPKWNGLLQQVSELEIRQKPSLTDTGSRIYWKDARGRRNEIVVTGNNEKGIATEMLVEGQRPLLSGFSIEKRQADSVQVVWYIVEDLKWYPWEKFYGMMAADMKGPQMQESLNRFKAMK